jgi:hypothetical protein
MLAAVSVAGTPNITAPEGWRLLVTNSAGTKLRQSVFLRTVTSNEPSSYTWTLSAKTAASISLVAYRSPALAGAGEIVAGQANSSSATITAPSVATPASDALYVGFYGVAANATIVPPPGMIEQAEVQSPNGGKVAVEAADEILASAGTVGERRATAAAPGVNIGQVVVLVPSGP